MFPTDETTRAGRMMSAGRVTVTFRSPNTGNHVTVTAKSRKPGDDGKWTRCPLDEAKVVFFSVPNAGGGWDDKVGKFTKSGGFTPDPHADPARVWCAGQLMNFVAGKDMGALECFEESRCGCCGRALTDPVSIERGIGPECFGMMTGSKHQAKDDWVDPEVEMVKAEMAAG